MGGVLLTLVPQSTMMLAAAGMMAPDGRCKTLDAAADGYVRAEACRMLFIHDPGASHTKNTHQHTQGAHVPIAVLMACGVNTNGRASALTAPHGPSQNALLRAVLGAAGVTAAEVAGLQLHANGTALGDPIEAGAGAAVFQVRVG